MEKSALPSGKLLVLSASHLESDLKKDVDSGLSAMPKRLPSKYFYDETGSKIFEEIMQLPEYYPTLCEAEILENNKEEILNELWEGKFNFVDLGAGDAKKTKILLSHFLAGGAELCYYPIDISQDALEDLLMKLAEEMPLLKAKAIMADYFDAITWLGQADSVPKAVFFLGSNIGNFSKAEAEAFLKKMQIVLEEGDMLFLGVDLKKDPRIIRNAYDDSKGVTARFNLNLLERINRELGGNFRTWEWEHYAGYDPISGEVQSFLLSKIEQEVKIDALDKSFHFDAYEAIHTEYSVKYSLKEIIAMLKRYGFEIVKPFLSKNGYFADVLCSVVRQSE